MCVCRLTAFCTRSQVVRRLQRSACFFMWSQSTLVVTCRLFYTMLRESIFIFILFFLFNCFLLAVSQHELSSLLAYVVMSQPQRHSFNKHVRTYTHTKHKCQAACLSMCRENNELFSLR